MKSNTKTKSLAATLASKNFSKIVTKYTVREGGGDTPPREEAAGLSLLSLTFFLGLSLSKCEDSTFYSNVKCLDCK